MKKTHLLTKPTRVEDIDFYELDNEPSQRWNQRAERMRIRNYRRLRHQEA